jgi:hypothetical protein
MTVHQARPVTLLPRNELACAAPSILQCRMAGSRHLPQWNPAELSLRAVNGFL